MPRKIFVSELQSVLLTRDFVHVSSLEMVHSQLSAGGPLELRKGEYLKWSQLLKPMWHLRYFQAICTFGGPVFFFFCLFFSVFWSQLFVKDIGICQLISWKYYTATSTDASFLYSAYGFVLFLHWDLQQRWRVAITVPRSGMEPPSGRCWVILNHSVTFANSILPLLIFLWFDWQSSNSSIHLLGEKKHDFSSWIPTSPATKTGDRVEPPPRCPPYAASQGLFGWAAWLWFCWPLALSRQQHATACNSYQWIKVVDPQDGCFPRWMFEDIFNYRLLIYYFWFLWYTNFEVIAILNAEFPARKPGLWLSCCFSRYFLCGGEFAWDGSHHQLSWVISSGDASDAQSSAFRRASYHSKGHGILCWKPQVVAGWADLRCWCWWSNKVKVKLACNPCC